MSLFEGEVDGVKVSVWFGDSKIEFSSPMLDEKYDSFPKLDRAIKAKLLSLRKDFTNPSAVFVDRWDKTPQPVMVTALDGNEYAWIKHANGKRTKERLDNLYVDGQAVEQCGKNEKQRNEETRKEWASLERWAPKK